MTAGGQLGGSDCEAISDGLLAQPVNALTSTVFIVAGLVVWFRLPVDQRYRTGSGYALLLILIGLGSVLYHGPQPTGAKQLHDLPIPALAMYTAAVLLARWRGRRPLLPGQSKYRWAALATSVVSAPVFYAAGRTGSPLCDPEDIVQPHGLWHVATAVAFTILGAMLFDAPRNRPGVADRKADT